MSNLEKLYQAAMAEAKAGGDRKEVGTRYAIGNMIITYAPGVDGHNQIGVIYEARKRKIDGSIVYSVQTEYGRYSVNEDHIRLAPPELLTDKEREDAQVYESITDRKGEQLHPGDRVRIKRYPRGTAEGVVVISKTQMVVRRNGSKKRALSVLDEIDGTIYELKSKGALKL